VGYEDPEGCAQGTSSSAAADRVTLTPAGLRAVHHELAAGGASGRVPAPAEACAVRRIAYDRAHRFVWFAAGEGFVWGAVDDEEDGASPGPPLQVAGVPAPLPPCDTPPTARCSLPAAEAWEEAQGRDGLAGVGRALRSTRFRLVSGHGASPSLQRVVAGSEGWGVKVNRIDVWPRLAPGAAGPALEQQVDAWACALAQEEDGAAWPGALLGGLLHLDGEGRLLGQVLSAPSAAQVTALARDPRDDSLWVGQGTGLLRLQAGRTVAYGGALGALGGQRVWDIQVVGQGSGRRVLVAFGGGAGRPGGVGLYSGEQ
jgi:hypothetical protein